MAVFTTPGARAIRRCDDLDRSISDRRFMRQLDQVRDLKEFMFEEKVSFHEHDLDKLDLAELSKLSFKRSGRAPTGGEWRLLDAKLSILSTYLNDDRRRKIRIRELGTYFVALPIVFMILSLVASSVSLLSHLLFKAANGTYDFNDPIYQTTFFFGVVSWAVAQGGLGACAFLGTAVISSPVATTAAASKTTVDQPAKRDSETSEGNKETARAANEMTSAAELADITNRNYLKSRIISGTLFGFLLGWPFASDGLVALNFKLFPSADHPVTNADLLVLLLPFLLGFSTNVALAVLGRWVMAIETFFGTPAARS